MSLTLSTTNPTATIKITDCDPTPAPVWTTIDGSATVAVAPDGLSAVFGAPTTLPDITHTSVAFKRGGADKTDPVTVSFAQGTGGGGGSGGLSFDVG